MVCPQEVCRKPQQVCGHDGVTYNTVCNAFSNRVAVDYEGPCHAVGALSDGAPDSACSIVSCPPLSSPGCRPVTPPGECSKTIYTLCADPHSGLTSDLFAGACCPICASMLQILWNKEVMNAFSKVWTAFITE